MTIFAVENFLIIPNLALPLMQGKFGSGLSRTNQQFLRGKFSTSLKLQLFCLNKKKPQGLIDQRSQSDEACEIEANGNLKLAGKFIASKWKILIKESWKVMYLNGIKHHLKAF